MSRASATSPAAASMRTSRACCPSGICASIEQQAAPVLPVFRVIQQAGNIPERDMYNTFNMGLGLVMAVAKEDADKALACHPQPRARPATSSASALTGEKGIAAALKPRRAERYDQDSSTRLGRRHQLAGPHRRGRRAVRLARRRAGLRALLQPGRLRARPARPQAGIDTGVLRRRDFRGRRAVRRGPA